jgi:hypothetical protein
MAYEWNSFPNNWRWGGWQDGKLKWKPELMGIRLIMPLCHLFFKLLPNKKLF